MEKHFRIICLVALVLLVITLPAAAIPSVIGSGVGSVDHGTKKLLESKDAWKISDGDKTIAVWIQIPPNSCFDLQPAGCDPNDAKNCWAGNRYYVQWRIFTPDGKDWTKDYSGVGNRALFNTDQGQIYLWQPQDFRKAVAWSTGPTEYGGFTQFVSVLKDGEVPDPAHPYQWQGKWKVETYIHDTGVTPRTSTLVNTQYFTLVDDTGPTPGPSYIPISPITSPIPPPSTQKIIIGGENYVDANVQKTGAEWDSVEEKCPKWRGNDWSGTGDYYLSHGGDTLIYLINSPATGNYVMWMRDWSDTNHAAGDRQVTVTIDGATIGTFDAASSFNKGTTGYGWDKFTTVNLGAGSHTLKITKKDTTSSAAIIDDLWFSSNLNEIPQSYTTHSEALCSATAVKTTTAVTTTDTPTIYCTAPICPSGKLVCLQKNGCPGGCGYSCETVITSTSVPWTQESLPKPVGIEMAIILISIGLGVVVFAKRRD